VSKLSRYFGRSPDRLGLEEVRVFQVHLVATGVSWPALNQIVCALRFFYGVTLGHAIIPERIAYAREPRKLPVVLSAGEVVHFLEAIPSLKSRTALTAVYAAGLRVSEVARLKIGDLDSWRMVIRVERGKVGKDRYVMLSSQPLKIPRSYWRLTRPTFWLFPDRDQDRPLEPTVLARRLPVGAGCSRSEQAGDGAHPAAHIRDPSAGERSRRSRHPGPARSCQPGEHRTLHPGCHQDHQQHAKPARPADAGGGAARLIPMSAGLEVADVLHRHGTAYRRAHEGHLGRVERRVMSAIELCRTAALGGHVEQCVDCGASRIAYNSCRNRHCPKCQGRARAEWLEARQAELLPVPYFHVVFTVPAPVAEIAYQNKAIVYAILFRAAAETLRTIAAEPKHLGAEIGLVAVLHTWGQTLRHHPHVHCVVPGGGPALDGTHWVACRPGFFLPVRVLSRLFRRLFLDELRSAFEAGTLGFFGALANLNQPAAFARRLRELRRVEWVVYAKPPFGGPEQVLAYLGRYTQQWQVVGARVVHQ
jgi:hypothetical protein